MSVIDGETRHGGAIAADSRGPTAIAGVGALLSVVTGWFIAGPAGALAGSILVAAWIVVSPIVVVALGHVLFAALLPTDVSLTSLATVGAPLLVIFTGSVLDTRAPLRTLWIGVVMLMALSALVAGGLATLDELWQTATILVGVIAVAGYGLHRYTVAALEVTDES